MTDNGVRRGLHVVGLVVTDAAVGVGVGEDRRGQVASIVVGPAIDVGGVVVGG